MVLAGAGHGTYNLCRVYNNKCVSDVFIADLERRIYGEDCIIVGFNIKYDLHWLRRYGLSIRPGRLKIWDCQLAEFLLENQLNPYPSLEQACILRSVSLKQNTLNQYLKQGIDVSEIPEQELSEYLKGDLISTEELFLKQVPLIKESGKWELFRLQCQDLLVLADMEYNGMKYDLEKSESLANICWKHEQDLITELDHYLPDLPVELVFNWNSGDHLSALLYGGSIRYVRKDFVGTYKNGKAKFKNTDYYHTFPRLVEPLQGSELKKEGFFSTDEDTLKGLNSKGEAEHIIKNVLKLAELSKLRGTYYEGIPKKFEEYGWEDGYVHGQINQVVAVTGRTNSLKPNLQNNPTDSKECFVSRYE